MIITDKTATLLGLHRFLSTLPGRSPCFPTSASLSVLWPQETRCTRCRSCWSCHGCVLVERKTKHMVIAPTSQRKVNLYAWPEQIKSTWVLVILLPHSRSLLHGPKTPINCSFLLVTLVFFPFWILQICENVVWSWSLCLLPGFCIWTAPAHQCDTQKFDIIQHVWFVQSYAFSRTKN